MGRSLGHGNLHASPQPYTGRVTAQAGRKRRWEARGSAPDQRSPAGWGSFAPSTGQETLPFSLPELLQHQEGTLIQGPEGETGKKQECKGISRLCKFRVTSFSIQNGNIVAPGACFVYFWLSLEEETPEEWVLAVLVPQNMPLQAPCSCSMDFPTLYLCSALLPKYRVRYFMDLSVPAMTLF